MLKDIIERCNNCELKECINCEITRSEVQELKALVQKQKQLGKGQHTLMQSRRKWKSRYYKERRKNKQLTINLANTLK